ncbi:MAG TPA: hypothetical protein VD772_08880, partial [Anseongella sp.]|nr:hypothetical protein [Anseongella sp.]
KYNVTILTGEPMKNCAISADFNDDPLDKVLKILAELVNGKVVEQDAGYLLKGSGCQEPVNNNKPI